MYSNLLYFFCIIICFHQDPHSQPISVVKQHYNIAKKVFGSILYAIMFQVLNLWRGNNMSVKFPLDSEHNVSQGEME